MAVYKVPQDVEAEDKLIGPFSFRQFIYLIVAALGIFAAWLLSKIFIGLIIIPLPIVIALLALALPLRKDQPMETYLIAMIKFFFKPRHRIWDPEGTIAMVRITAPKVSEGPQLKGYGGDEASQRLAYLAQIVDTHGWASRGAMSANDNLSDIVVAEATQAEDILDDSSGVAQAFSQRIAEADDARKEAVLSQMQSHLAASEKSLTNEPALPPQQPTGGTAEGTTTQPVHYSPYPKSIHQHVLSPSSGQPVAQTGSPTEPSMSANQPGAATVSPDIMRLANNNDLSISAIAHEAQRLKDNDQNEVVVKLR